jgi:tetratricopeptide (TPR) repeat protein
MLKRCDEAVKDATNAVAVQEELVAEAPKDAQRIATLARAQNSLGDVQWNCGRQKESMPVYRRVIETWERVCKEEPKSPQYQADLAHAQFNYGQGFRMLDQPKQALEWLDRATAALKLAAADGPETEAIQLAACGVRKERAIVYAMLNQMETAFTEQKGVITFLEAHAKKLLKDSTRAAQLAEAHEKLGDFYRLAQKPDEAETEYQITIDMLEKLANGASSKAAFINEQAECHAQAGVAFLTAKRFDKAETHFRQAIAIREKLLEGESPASEFVVGLGGDYNRIGLVYLMREDYMVADEWFGRAIAKLDPVAKKDSGNAGARLVLSNACWGQATALTKLKRYRDSILLFDRAVELGENNLPSERRQERAVALAHAGEHQRAITEADALAKANPISGDIIYNSACVYGLAAGTVKADQVLFDKYAERTMELLRQCQKVGYFDEAYRIEHVKKDTDIDALRERPELQKWLKELMPKK